MIEQGADNSSTAAVGRMLRKRRELMGLSLSDIEVATKIRGKYLVSLEACDYIHLPNDIYTRGFVQHYANFLGLDGTTVAQQFQIERGGNPRASATRRLLTRTRRTFIITPAMIIAAVSILTAGAIVAYLTWQFTALAAAPRIELSSPASDQVISGGLIDVTGSVTPGSDVFVNDSPVLTDGNGVFSDKLALQDGLNTLRVTAKSRLGKTSTVTRSILAKIPKIAPVASDGKPQTVDGINVEVSIKGQATALTVSVDGQEPYRVTMLADSTQLFSGKNSIKITTNNAGSTFLSITNTLVIGKKVGPLGSNGEVKRDLIFNRDTNFTD